MSDTVIVESQTMRELFAQARRIAAFPSTVLIEGETGVGKEVIAEWIHQNSPRSQMPFIKINCGAIPESLLESELFGYERGAFTGAKREGNPGLFELADNGTILLDEIGELSVSMQVKLLRVLQEREIRRIGGSWSKSVDVRILASTNRNLRHLVEQARFREDLYYRLQVAYLHVPPLRERREEIRPLLEHYLERIGQEFQLRRRFTPEAMEILSNYNFPGNVRELRNLVEGLCIRVEDEWIEPHDLPAQIMPPAPAKAVPPSHPPAGNRSLQQQLDAVELQILKQALQEADSIRKAANSLQISHATLLRKMQKHEIKLS
jgi:transcriptional regulator with PAS, ATPase and Fis domain